MNRSIQLTSDGSRTLYVPELDECYHSRHGALQESLHVFIDMGLRPALAKKKSIHIFEMGLGTGLNLLLTAQFENGLSIRYTTAEAYPITKDEARQMEYTSQADLPLFESIHSTPWGEDVKLTEHITLHKLHAKLADIDLNMHPLIDLVYYDAFAPEKQPKLWTEEVFEQLYNAMSKGGILVTYCAKGAVKRAMRAAGFDIEKLPGPPGKREMTRATKP